MKVKSLAKAISLVALGAASSSAFAAGFQVSEQSAASLGRALAGDGAFGDSAAVLANNPAAMSLLKGRNATFHVSYVDPTIEITGTSTGSILTDQPTAFVQDSATSGAVVPSMFATFEYNDKITLGIGAYSDFGFATEYDDNFVALELADLSDIVSININPSMSYQVNDQLSLGLGVSLVYMHAEISSTRYSGAASEMIALNPATGQPVIDPSTGMPMMVPSPIPPGANIQQLEGDDVTWGWNVGALYQFNDSARIGVSYKSEVDSKLDGDVTSDINKGQAPGIPNWNQPGSVEITLPSILEVAAYLDVTENLALSASYYNIGWSSFDEIAPELEDGGYFPATPEHWNDSDRFSVGATYSADKWTFRAGVMFDESPVDDEHRTLRIPDADRTWYTLGASYEVCGNCTVDFGYAYITGDKATIEEESPLNGQTGGLIGVGTVNATLDATGNVFSAGVNFKF